MGDDVRPCQAIRKTCTFQRIIKSPYYPSRVLLEGLLLVSFFAAKKVSRYGPEKTPHFDNFHAVFELLRILVFFCNICKWLLGLKVNFSRFSRTEVIASTVGWFLHFTTAFRVRRSILSDTGSTFCDSGKFRL